MRAQRALPQSPPAQQAPWAASVPRPGTFAAADAPPRTCPCRPGSTAGPRAAGRGPAAFSRRTANGLPPPRRVACACVCVAEAGGGVGKVKVSSVDGEPRRHPASSSTPSAVTHVRAERREETAVALLRAACIQSARLLVPGDEPRFSITPPPRPFMRQKTAWSRKSASAEHGPCTRGCGRCFSVIVLHPLHP